MRAGEIMDQNLARRMLETEALQGKRREMNLDAHMVLILGALLCAIIGAIGVSSIVRCVLRFRYRFRRESSEQAAARLAATGLKKRDLGRIPVGVYGSDVKIKGADCAICLGEFEAGDKVRMLPICNHGFHVGCIDTWLLSHSSCPYCRHSLLHPPVKGTPEAADVSSPPPPGSASSHFVVVIQSSN